MTDVLTSFGGDGSARKDHLLELAFESQELRAICEVETEARRKLGDAVAEILKHRLADLRSAASVEDVPAGRPRVLGDSGGRLVALDLASGYRIVIGCNHIKPPLTDGGDINWGRVTRIKILGVEMQHG